MKEHTFSIGNSQVDLLIDDRNKYGLSRMRLTKNGGAVCYHDYGGWGQACNAVFYGNKIIFFFCWSNVTDNEIAAAMYQELKLVLLPFRKTLQFIVKLGDMNWSDVICHFPGPKEYNDKNAPVEEIDFVMIDTDKDEIVATREIPVPQDLAEFFMVRNRIMMELFESDYPTAYNASYSPSSVALKEMFYQNDPEKEWYDSLLDEIFYLFNDESIVNKYSFQALYQAKGAIVVTAESDEIIGIKVNQ